MEAESPREGEAWGGPGTPQSRQKTGHQAAHLGPATFEVPTVPWHTRDSPLVCVRCFNLGAGPPLTRGVDSLSLPSPL